MRMWGDVKISKPYIERLNRHGICPNNVERTTQGVVSDRSFFCCLLRHNNRCSKPPPVPRGHTRPFRATSRCLWPVLRQTYAQYLARITPVLGADYSSTWHGLLQYLARITQALGTDYSSTWRGLLKHLARITQALGADCPAGKAKTAAGHDTHGLFLLTLQTV